MKQETFSSRVNGPILKTFVIKQLLNGIASSQELLTSFLTNTKKSTFSNYSMTICKLKQDSMINLIEFENYQPIMFA